tara:strand:+ start:1052 stop:1399 length:348 start_codon:yes stop_codon:yes gene_type:complete
MAKGDKININLQRLEGSMEGIMNQMGLGVNVVGGGSQGIPKKGKTFKKGTKSPQGEKSSSKPGSAANLGDVFVGKVGGEEKKKTGEGHVKVDTTPVKKKEDAATVKIGDVNRRKP